jgi:uncharacterized protein (TIRG00374 family)
MKASQKERSATTLMSGRLLRRGLVTFTALTVAGFGALYIYGLRSQAKEVATNLSTGFFTLALLAVLFDLFIGGFRHYVFLRYLVPGTRLRLPIFADLVGRLASAVTPSQSGGGPGQIFMLHRGGVPLPAILSTLTVNLLATLVFFVLAGVPATFALGDQVSSGVVRQLIFFGFGVVLGLAVLLALALTRPDLLVRPVAALVRKLDARDGAVASATRRVGSALVECAGGYKRSCAQCLREGGALPFVALVLTVVMYLNKFTLGWLIVRGLGFEVSYVLALSAQLVIQLILYAAPTPGGSGIAEISTGAVMSLLIPPGALVSFTLAYRFLLSYLPAAVGAFILARELRSERKTARAAGTAVAAGVIALATPPAVRVTTTVAAPIPSPSCSKTQPMIGRPIPGTSRS